MPDFDNELTGVLFPELNKKTEKSPDFTGKCQVDGINYRIAAWRRETSAEGRPFLSLRLTNEEEREKEIEAAKNALDL